jgi:queuine/archaeosine tRNA-ribosyltransferase
MLTDSGGFQMVSLLKLAEITEVESCETPADSKAGGRAISVAPRWHGYAADA